MKHEYEYPNPGACGMQFFVTKLTHMLVSGEKNQIAGISNQLKNLCNNKNKDFVTKEFDVENQSEFETQLKELETQKEITLNNKKSEIEKMTLNEIFQSKVIEI